MLKPGSSARRCAEETAGPSVPGSAILASSWPPWSLTYAISIRQPALLAAPRRPNRSGGPRAPPTPWSAPVTWLGVVSRTPHRDGPRCWHGPQCESQIRSCRLPAALYHIATVSKGGRP
jgi:hypothetical protein